MTNVPCAHSATMTHASDLQPCWMLHRRPYRNTSLIADFLTPVHGRVPAVVRGGQASPALQPFQQLYVSFSGRGDLLTVRKHEAGQFFALAGDSLFCGLYMNELLMRMLHPHDPVPELVTLYATTLQKLAESGGLLDVSLRHFEFDLMEQLGYGISLQADIDGNPIDPACDYACLPDQGLMRAQPGEHVFAGADLVAFASGRLTASARLTAKRLARTLLAPHLGDKPLASRVLFNAKKKKQPNGDA